MTQAGQYGSIRVEAQQRLTAFNFGEGGSNNNRRPIRTANVGLSFKSVLRMYDDFDNAF